MTKNNSIVSRQNKMEVNVSNHSWMLHICRKKKKTTSVLTRMCDRFEGDSAVLNVKWEFVNMHSAGAGHHLTISIFNPAVMMDVYMRIWGGFIPLSPVPDNTLFLLLRNDALVFRLCVHFCNEFCF